MGIVLPIVLTSYMMGLIPEDSIFKNKEYSDKKFLVNDHFVLIKKNKISRSAMNSITLLRILLNPKNHCL